MLNAKNKRINPVSDGSTGFILGAGVGVGLALVLKKALGNAGLAGLGAIPIALGGIAVSGYMMGGPMGLLGAAAGTAAWWFIEESKTQNTIDQINAQVAAYDVAQKFCDAKYPPPNNLWSRCVDDKVAGRPTDYAS